MAMHQPPSLLSAGTMLVGSLTAQGDIQIDGAMEGDVRCARLTVGSSGTLRGEIDADAVIVHGRIEGTVRARTVSMAATARVTGMVVCQLLDVAHGAQVEARFARAAQATADSMNTALLAPAAE